MSDNHIDYLEQLFQGVDILIERKLKDVSFDTTIICTVTDASDSKNGRYQVTDGTIRFEAYSDNDKYKANDQVRVSIARGDYTDKKYIIGKYVSDNNTQPITYISPLDTVVNITGNLIPESKQNADIIANGTTKEKLIWNESLADGSYADLQTNGIYSAITLKADFRTFLHNYNIKSGSYGLRLDLIVKPTKDSTTAILKTAYLDSSEMFGNPYAFSIATQQTKIFDIGTAGIITGVALSLYQNGDFIDVNGISITPALIGNIIVENIEIGFGSNLVSIGDNTLQIYTENDPQYKYFGHEPYPYDAQLGYPNTINKATNEKTLGLLWYNKNDLNEYLGFSDGIYDPNYDEITYLSEANQDARLIAQLGRDGIPTDSDSLKLAADLEDAISLITSANKIITQDLTTTLRAFKSQLQDIPGLTTYIDNLIALTQIDDEVIPLSIIAANIQSNLTNLQSQYLGVLGHGVRTQNGSWLNEDEKNKGWSNDWNTNYGYNIKTAFEATRTAIDTLLTNIYDDVYGENAAYNGYAGIYDTYKIRLEKVLLSMEVYLQENSKYHFPIDVFNGINQTLLSSYKNTKIYWKSYIKKDLSQYDNRYCIYWFRYEKNYKNAEPYQFLSSGWRRLTDIPHNIGLPGPGEIIDTKIYNAKKLNAGEGLINVLMRFNEPEERYKAVLFYNHAMYESNEIVFTNEDRIPEVANVETGDLLLIKHIDKSRDNYQCYNLTNYLMDSADASHLRQVRVSYDGLLHGDDILPGGGIYWYVPNTSTMLTVDIDELSSRGFVNDSNVNPKPPYHKPGYICFYKQIQGEKDEDGKWNFNDGNGIDTRDFWYKIKPYYDASANINSIKCEFRAASDNDIVTGETFFSFGIMGSNGTKYTLSINPATNQVATLPTKDLILDVSLRDFNNEEIDLKVGANAIGETSEFNSNWLFKLSGNAPMPILNDTTVTGLTAFKGSCGIVQASTKFQLSAAGTTETTNGTTKYRTVTLETVRAIPAAAGDYYLSGPTSIVYNSFGTIDNRSMFDNPYKLFAMKTITLGSKTYNPNDQIDVNWDFNYYDSDGNKLSDEDKTFYENYMPVLNDAGGLTPAPMYLDNLNCYMVIEAYAATTNDLLWSQPIVITQNRFASSVLNDWDGSLTIDEKNGTILSSMIGAGRKTDHNTFEGVLMGNIAVGTNSDIGFEKNADIGYANHTGLGLYGFHDGAQSFGFNVDGTAFLGKAGRGRIIFNGNQGVIASTNWFLSGGTLHRAPPADGTSWIKSPGTDGMCIDLENGHIDAYNFKLTSKNVIIDSSETATAYLIVKNNDSGNNLIYISPSEYYIQSDDFDPNTKGMHLNLVDGEIIAYQFELDSKNIYINSDADGTGYGVIEIKGNDSGNSLTLTNDSAQDPIGIRDSSNNALFVVGWDGSITTPNFNVDGDGNLSATSGDIGGWKINEHSLSSNSTYLRSSAGDTVKAIEINSGTFYVQNNGYMYASSGSIGGWNISSTKLSKGVIELTNAGTIQSTKGNLTIDGTTGKLTATGATLTTLTVNKSLSIAKDGGNGSLSVAGTTQLDGTLTVGTSTSAANTSITGNTAIKGKLIIGSGTMPSDDSKTLYINGTSQVTKSMTFDADIILTGNNAARRIYGSANTSDDLCIYFDDNSGGRIYLAGPVCTIASDTVNLGKNSDSNSGTISNVNIRGNLKMTAAASITLPKGSAINIAKENGSGTQTLLQYIKSNASIFGGSYDENADQVSMNANTSLALVTVNSSNVMTTTLKAPAMGSAGQFLKLTSTTGSTAWVDLPTASTTVKGIVRTNYTTSGKNYKVSIDSNGDLYCNVPWTDTNTTYTGSGSSAVYKADRVKRVSGNAQSYMATVGTDTYGSVYIGMATSTIQTKSSSKRFKHNINLLLDSSDLYKLTPKSFIFNKDQVDKSGLTRYGFIAEEVAQISENLISYDVEDPTLVHGVEYNSILTLAVAEIQKLRKELDDLKSNLNI